jgi:vacuolar-type H+-ATPase subunit F/Vma7
VLCDPAVEPGFALASLRVRTSDPAGAASALEELATEPRTGVVLVQSDLYDAAAGPELRRLERQTLPVLLPFPGPRWAARPSAEEYVVELLRRAIGYRVRLR